MSEYMRNRRGGEEGNEGFFCRFTFGQFFAILILEVFTLFFVFYLGARYGREFLGLDAIAAAPAVAQGDAAGLPTNGGPEPQVLSTSDPEAARMARELIDKARTPELKERISKMFDSAQGEGKTPEVVERNRAAAEPPSIVPATPTPARENTTIISGGEERPMGDDSTPPAETAQGRPASAPATDASRAEDADTRTQATGTSVIRVKSSDSGRYSVQVGSYPQLTEATRTVEKWKGKGYPAYMMIADIPDRGRWYRVRIGGFSTRDDASRYLKEFQSRESVEALIVMNEQ